MKDTERRDALQPGEQIHWYRIEQVLGQGGFGITYLARDTNLDQRVAIKEFLPTQIAVRVNDNTVQPRSVEEDEPYRRALDRFIKEAQTLNRFDHPHIVRVHSVFEANNTAYMVMRHENGNTLHDHLERRRTLEESELIQILWPILNGLREVHAAGFIHRDIQPANIHIRDDGSPVLLDFGSAREAVGRAGTMTVYVTPGYAPLEQYYSSGEQQGAWTDIYGLGATLYRAVTGTRPIDAVERSRGSGLASTQDMLVPAATLAKGRYSPGFLGAIDHALKLSPGDRPQTVDEWQRDFEPPPPPPPLPTETDRPKPPPIARRWVLGAIVGILGLGIGWFLRFDSHAPQRPAASPPAPVSTPADTRSGELEDLKRSIAEDRENYAALQRELTDAKEELADLKSTQDEAYRARLEAVAGDLQARETQLARLKEEITPLEQRRDALKKEVDAAEQSFVAGDGSTPPGTPAPATAGEAATANPTAPRPESQVAAVEAIIQPAPDPLALGIAAYESGDHAAAISRLRPLAENGDAEATYYLGRMHAAGQGVNRSETKALAFFKKAADRGHAGAQLEMGRLLANGEGVEQDPFYAYVWLFLAAEAGSAEAVRLRDTVAAELQPVQLDQARMFAAAKRKQFEPKQGDWP